MAAPDTSKFVELLQAMSNKENSIRKQAEAMYQQAKQSEPDQLMIGLMAILGTATIDEAVRRQAAVLLRQTVMKGPEKDFCYARITPQNQQLVAGELLKRFEQEPILRLQKKVGEVVSMLVEYVCDRDDPRARLDPSCSTGWPALLPLVFRMADPSTTSSADSCESALRLLGDIVPTLKDDIVGAKQQLGQILQLGLSHSSLKLRTAALLLICGIVTETEKTAWAPLVQTAGVAVQVVQQLAQANEEDLLQEAIQAFIEVACVQPDFFKGQLSQAMEPAKTLASLAKSWEGADNGIQNLALEFLVSYLEKRVKWLKNNAPAYFELVLDVCMHLMLKVEDGEQELAAWVARMDDEEGEEDEDELFHSGQEAIDRVVEAATVETLGTALFQLIGAYAGQDPWQAKHAALAAIKQTVEYVEEKSHIGQMGQLLLQHVDHPHPRVRYTALHALGQLANDQSPHFQESAHPTVMPVLLKKMGDPVDRVAAMSMSAFSTFAEDLDTSLMLGYAQGFMETLVGKLQTTQHRGLREESITSIAVIAGVIEKDFSKYYDGIMPLLKQFVMHATSEKENRLRGKSFECMSLLGIAVGKEKFLPDAREAIQEMMKTTLESDNVQREYIKEASERICQCLKKDFAPFLQGGLLEGIFRNLTLVNEPTPAPGKEDDEDDIIEVSTGDGKTVRVRTQKFEEMTQSVQLLSTFCTVMEGAYFDFVPATAKALLPLLTATNDYEEVRGTTLLTWGLLIKCAAQGAQERSLPNSIARELLSTGLQNTVHLLDSSKEAELLAETATGITECIKNGGAGILSGEETTQLVAKMFTLIDQSFVRTGKLLKEKQDEKTAATSLPKELGEEDDDDENYELEEEDQLRRNYEEVLGALMQVAPAEFMPCLPVCAERIKGWIATKENKVLGLYLACDLIQHLKEQSEPVWPCFMQEVYNAMLDEDADARRAAAYAIGLAAPLSNFSGQAAVEAFRRLVQIVGGARPKKRDDKGKLALDNAVAALLTLAVEKPTHCPPEVQVWPTIIARLPLRDDEDEAKKIHEKLVDLVLEQHAGLLGPERANLGTVLSILAEVHHMENICNEKTEERIPKVFRFIPTDTLQVFATSFTEKQQKKIEKMLAEPAA
eukprot:CAMPEP_0179276760 /NCGR_PEP_ID=MMETSP0797-20121207/34745_1 /TAXON_ID=47934 /ORGANISM="Dinophysis acuminata, Strain DAEP01" /LENGTH=1120 /DNA_ID=CAMNT_0020985329 /DNA_START=47 /DNA_END=3409 /DNA_ORIENTATION=+